MNRRDWLAAACGTISGALVGRYLPARLAPEPKLEWLEPVDCDLDPSAKGVTTVLSKASDATPYMRYTVIIKTECGDTIERVLEPINARSWYAVLHPGETIVGTRMELVNSSSMTITTRQKT